jgi:hypothetical protein
MKRVILEVLRRYPSRGLLPRTCGSDAVIEGFRIQAERARRAQSSPGEPCIHSFSGEIRPSPRRAEG